ncbi:MAG: T9SS type A sorting domain-containing protein, partial [Bacteroidales bacterium]
IVDLNNSGQLDFVVGTWDNVNPDSNKVYAYRCSDHSLLWTYPIGDVMYHGTAVADLDKNDKVELVIGSYNDTIYCINGDNGTTKWKYAYAPGYYTGAPVSIADIDNDDSCEVVFCSYCVVGALSASGHLKWHYDIPNNEQAFRGVALADINNDSYLDVIFATDGGKVIALNGNDGSLIWTINLAADYGDSLFSFDNAPIVADFANDDSLGIFIVGGHGEYPAFQNDFGRAYMLSAGKGNGPAWSEFQKDIVRNSSMCGVTTGINEPPQNIENNSLTVTPNPTNDNITVNTGDLRSTINDIRIYDIVGNMVFEKNMADYKASIDVSALPGGVYVVEVKTEKGVSVRRFIKE